MPLDRAHVTPASRVMLPGYLALYSGLALIFYFQAPSRTNGGAFNNAKMLLEPVRFGGWTAIQMWAVVFAGMAAVMATAMLAKVRRIMIGALIVAIGLTVFWAYLIYRAAVDDSQVSYSSALWPALAALAQFASGRSVWARER